MKKENGCSGKILVVDLENQRYEIENIPDEVYENYLSGLGLAVHYLYQNIPAGADPLGPENILGFVSGMLTGSGSLFSGRWMAVGKSPLTNTWGEANCGGNLSPAIKQCGFDGIFIKGISPKPVYLMIDNDQIEIKDASHLWGKDTLETESTLLEETGSGKKATVACIGPAGEKLSLISGISNDHGRFAARSGLGALMGSKRLKALVLRGKQKIKVHDRKEIIKLNKDCLEVLNKAGTIPAGNLTAYIGTLFRIMPFHMANDGMAYISMLKKWGTIGMNQVSLEMGDSPIQNWKGSNKTFNLNKSQQFNPDRILKYESKKYHCYSCPVGCGGYISNGNGSEPMHKPEYETMIALGALLDNNDLHNIIEINDKINRVGFDTISAGGTMAFAMECYEKGVITRDDLGFELNWGNAQAITKLLDLMVNRKGVGDILADGVKRASEILKQGSQDWAIHSGGQEIAMHDPRNDPGYGIHAVVEPAPGRHTAGSFMNYEIYRLWKKINDLPVPPRLQNKDKMYQPDEEKGITSAATSCFTQMLNGAGLCMFGAMMGVDRIPIFEWLNAAGGWEKSPEEYMRIGKRIQTLKQMFNIKQGIDPLEIKLNKLLRGNPPMQHGANKSRKLNMEELRKSYYRAIGWDENSGVPTQECLRELKLETIIGNQKEILL